MDDLNILGMDRMVRRAFESATAENKNGVAKWHKAEIDAVRRISEKQEPLGDPFHTILHDNLWSLYESGNKTPNA